MYRRHACLAAALASGLLAAVADVPRARAQATDKTIGTQANQMPPAPPVPVSLPPTQAIDAPPAMHLFGDWDGYLSRLASQGINLQLDALTEFAGNVSGGVKQNSTFASQIGLQNDINWERLAGVTGLSTHVIFVSRSGSSASTGFGDNLLPVQEIFGSGGDVAVHFVSAYAEETLYDKRLDIAAGRMNVENDFASSPLYCNFLNNGVCGDPKALPGGDIGHSAYPDAVWAARLRVRPTPQTVVTVGVYEVNQGLYTDQYYRSGFAFNTSKDSGVYLPLQLGWEPKLGANGRPGHYYIGMGYDTSAGYKDFGNVLAAASVPGFTDQTRHGSTQVWALADQMLVRHGQGDAAGIIGLAGFVHNDPNTSVYAEQYFAGLVDQGFWKARPLDTIGLLVTHNTVSGRLGNVQGIEQALGLPYSNGATGIQSHETVFEANYTLQVVPGLTFQPDLQYVVRPNGQTNIHDALVLGFRAHITL